MIDKMMLAQHRCVQPSIILKWHQLLDCRPSLVAGNTCKITPCQLHVGKNYEVNLPVADS